MSMTGHWGPNLLLKINDVILSHEEREILSLRSQIGDPVNILLTSRNIDYVNIIDDDYSETHNTLIELVRDIKSASPDSLVMIDAEGGVVQRLRKPLARTSHPANISFNILYQKLLQYFQNPSQETSELVRSDEIFDFFGNKALWPKVSVSSLITAAEQGSKSAKENALEVVSHLVEQNYTAMAQDLQVYGIDVALAPVADFYDGNTGAIQSRSFGNEVEVTAKLCAAAANGIRKGGLANCIKHFVGQGQARDTNLRVNDGHQVPLTYTGTFENLMSTEGRIFQLIFEHTKNIDYLMISNIRISCLPEDDGKVEPLPLSNKALAKLIEAIGVPDKIKIMTDDVFDMPLRDVVHDKRHTLNLIVEVSQALKKLKRQSTILMGCTLSEFMSINGFDILDESCV